MDVKKMIRCGECEPCRRLESARLSVLKVANPPFSRAGSETIEFWNRELKENVCKDFSDEIYTS